MNRAAQRAIKRGGFDLPSLRFKQRALAEDVETALQEVFGRRSDKHELRPIIQPEFIIEPLPIGTRIPVRGAMNPVDRHPGDATYLDAYKNAAKHFKSYPDLSWVSKHTKGWEIVLAYAAANTPDSADNGFLYYGRAVDIEEDDTLAFFYLMPFCEDERIGPLWKALAHQLISISGSCSHFCGWAESVSGHFDNNEDEAFIEKELKEEYDLSMEDARPVHQAFRYMEDLTMRRPEHIEDPVELAKPFGIKVERMVKRVLRQAKMYRREEERIMYEFHQPEGLMGGMFIITYESRYADHPMDRSYLNEIDTMAAETCWCVGAERTIIGKHWPPESTSVDVRSLAAQLADSINKLITWAEHELSHTSSPA